MKNELMTTISIDKEAVSTVLEKIPEEVFIRHTPLIIIACVGAYFIKRHYDYCDAKLTLEHGHNYNVEKTSFIKDEVVTV